MRHLPRTLPELSPDLAWHDGSNYKELDFIMNYDIKYRMGRDADEDK